MLKSLLVGLSGSPCSQEAMRLAIRWAQTHRANLVGLGVVDDELLAPAESVPLGAGQMKSERDQIMLVEGEHHIDDALRVFEQTCQAANVPRKTFKTHGRVADRLCEHAQRVDLVVVGHKRANSLESTAPVSHALETILKRAIRPVVSVAHWVEQGSSVLVGYDGSLQAARTLAAFVQSGLFADLPVRLIAVEKSLGDLAYHTSLASEFLENHGRQVDVRCFSTDESPAEALLRLMSESRPALAVLGAFGKKWLREALLGSVTATLLRKAEVPLFLYH